MRDARLDRKRGVRRVRPCRAGKLPGASHRVSGQAMVEFAFLLPLFLVLIFAILDFGYCLFLNVSLNHAVRAGVRLASMNTFSRPQVQQEVVDACVGCNLSASQVEITTRASDATLPGTPPSCEVHVSYNHRLFLPGFWGQTDALRVQSTFRSIVTTYGGNATISF